MTLVIVQPVDSATAAIGRDSKELNVFKPKNWLDRVFEVGIVGKGLNGLVELVGGFLLLLVSPQRIQSLTAAWTHGELSEDPHDFIASHLLHTASGLTGQAVVFGALYLLAHGLVKTVLVVALLLNKLWAYPWMIAVLLLFIAYQLYRIALDPTAALIGLTVFDAVIVLLTWREFKQQRKRKQPKAEPVRTDGGASSPRS